MIRREKLTSSLKNIYLVRARKAKGRNLREIRRGVEKELLFVRARAWGGGKQVE